MNQVKEQPSELEVYSQTEQTSSSCNTKQKNRKYHYPVSQVFLQASLQLS
jgi:hypothetical protein